MSSTIVQHDDDAVASRHVLRAASVYCVNLIGGPGSGKSTLIEQTIRRLAPSVRAGAVVCDGRCRYDAERPLARQSNVVEIDPRDASHLDPSQVREAIGRLDLASLDLLLVENVGTMIVPPGRVDFGQDATVAVFSVAAGDDKALRHPEMIEAADAVVLNKTDLTLIVPFDVRAFKADVDRAKPGIDFFAASAFAGRGLEPWLNWLRGRATKRDSGGEDVSHWFG